MAENPCRTCFGRDGRHLEGCGGGSTPPVFLRIAVRKPQVLATLDLIVEKWRATGSTESTERLREIAVSALLEQIVEAR